MGHIAHIRKQFKSINTYGNIKTFFRYFLIISPRKRAGPSFEQTWIPLTQRCAKFGWNWPSGSKEEDSIFLFCQYIFDIISHLKKAICTMLLYIESCGWVGWLVFFYRLCCLKQFPFAKKCSNCFTFKHFAL